MSDQKQKAWVALCDKVDRKGYEHLSSDERIWFNVRILIDAVDNGGLISFYYNSGADYLDGLMADLKTIGAQDIVELLEQINALFPGQKPSRDIDKRNQVIDSWHDGENNNLLEQLDKKFYALEAELETNLQPIINQVIKK